MKSRINTNNFKKLITKFIQLNNILYNKIIKKKYENSREKSETYVKKNFCEKRSHFKNKNQIYAKITFIKLNATTQRKKKKFKIKRDNNNKTTCYLCDKLNYFAKDC